MEIFRLTLTTILTRKTFAIFALILVALPLILPEMTPWEEKPEIIEPTRAQTAWSLLWLVSVFWLVHLGASFGNQLKKDRVLEYSSTLGNSRFSQLVNTWLGILPFVGGFLAIVLAVSIFGGRPESQSLGAWTLLNVQSAWLYALIILPLIALAVGIGARWSTTLGFVIPAGLAFLGLYGVSYFVSLEASTGNPLAGLLFQISPHYHLGDLTSRITFAGAPLSFAEMLRSSVYFLGLALLVVIAGAVTFGFEKWNRLVIAIVPGVALLALGFFMIQGQEVGLKYHNNPFGLKQSAYGRLLASLSQDTINRNWHSGVEQVNPLTHTNELKTLPSIAEKFKKDGFVGALALTRDGLSELRNAGYHRTNKNAVSEKHQDEITRDLELMFLRAYEMNPTNYGVYNGYHLFLTIHELSGTPAARKHARVISQHTINVARGEETDPSAWLTAAMAAQNLFFMDQEDATESGTRLNSEQVREHSQMMEYCMHRYQVLKENAIKEKRWYLISKEKRNALDDRERFATRTSEMFSPMIARLEKSESLPTAPAPQRPEYNGPVVQNAPDESETE